MFIKLLKRQEYSKDGQTLYNNHLYMIVCFYLVNAICSLIISLYFFLKRDGILRKIIILFFISLACYQLSWAFLIFDNGEITGLIKNTANFSSPYWYFANLPFTFSLIIFSSYIIYKWRQ